MNNNTTALSLKTLLSDGKYIIPIYQRNYAWGKAEISQLIRDIKEFFTTNPNKNYYIGSLVCFKRENGDFELIDGQQRHTTISLINAVLKSLNIDDSVSSSNLKFDSRKNVQRFLEELYATSDFESFIETSTISGIQNFIDAISFIREEFNAKDENANPFNIESFAKNFYDKVKFFRVEVPQDTDLNHYFEIMNNRGEQLEKHEIVKALLMGEISDKNEQEIFATVWDACSDMNDYVYFNFDVESRGSLFSGGCLQPNDFYTLKEYIKTNNEDKDIELFEILKKNNLPEDFPKEERQAKEKYKSVIDFPNFLLQVLKLEYDDISLDDKGLLKSFNENTVEPKSFIFKLLKYRAIFDKYIIKQDLSDSDEEKQNWSVRTLNTSLDDVARTYENDYDELIKLQTMLYYSNPSSPNNNWVHQILKKNYFNESPIEFTQKVLSEIAKPRFDKTNLSYPDITAYNLYFIDLLLWKLYKTEEVQEDLKSLKDKIDNLKGQFNTFKFKQLNSKEHLLPQSKATESEFDLLNNLGNLCLISTAQNSSANDQHPKYKREQFKNDNSSLKRLIMFKTYDGERWGINEIINHEKEMQSLIDNML